jgi:hypothetical protein
MKNLILLSIVFLGACTSAIKDDKSEKEEPASDAMEVVEEFRPVPTENLSMKSREDMIGYWVGWFIPVVADSLREYKATGEWLRWDGSNKINVSIDSFNNDSVFGHSVVANNYQTFKGIIKNDKNGFSAIVYEPGADKHDGMFKFEIPSNDSILKGTWEAYKDLKTKFRRYSLSKRIFKYDASNMLSGGYADWEKFKEPDWIAGDTIELPGEPDLIMTKEELANNMDMDVSEINDDNYQDLFDEFVKWEREYYSEYFATTGQLNDLNSSARLLTQAEVENLTKADLYVLRNSIYARHGYSFRKRQLRAYFDKQDWYIPVHANIKSDLTEIEKKNIQLLLKYEEHAEEYYDEFGRG